MLRDAGHTTTELFASGGVHALVRLLDNVLEYAREPQRSVWVREVLALLYPLVRRSRMVARLLVSATLGSMCPNSRFEHGALLYELPRLRTGARFLVRATLGSI